MKKILFTVALMALALSGFAQETESNAIYVYRNDGGFNAFFFSEIDSITYSQYGADSVAYDDINVQVVWTKDSVYRIPTDVIDSISFTKPETRMQSDVVLMDETWLPYIVNVEGMDITFTPGIFSIWQPKEGDVLVYMNFDDAFPDGFAGRVSEIVTDENIQVSCDSVDIDDIYDQIIIMDTYDIYETSDPADGRKFVAVPRQARKGNENGGSFNVEVCRFLTVGANYTTSVKPFLYKTSDLFIFELKFDYAFNIIGDLHFPEKDEEDQLYIKVVNVSVPIPNTPLKLTFATGPFFDYGIKAEFSAHLSVGTSSSCTWRYENGKFTKSTSSSGLQWSWDVDGCISGEFSIGERFDIGFKTVGGFLETETVVKPAKTISCTIPGSLKTLLASPSRVYENLKDIQVYSYNKCNIDVEANIKVFKWKVGTKFNLYNNFSFSDAWYLFPEFSHIRCSKNGSDVNFTSYVTRNLFLPVTLGYKVEKGSKCLTQYQSGMHWAILSSVLSLNFSNLSGEYVVKPVFKWLAMEIEATPQSELKVSESESGLCLASEDEDVVFFQKPAGWSSSIYCYLDDAYSGPWPGIRAQDIGNGYYKVVLASVPPEGNLIIWSVGGSQCESDPQTNDLTFSNRTLYIINGSAENPNYYGGMNFAETEDCNASPSLPTCSKTPVSTLCNQCECKEH